MIPAYMTSPFPFDLNYSTADHYDEDNNDGDDQNPKLFFASSSNYQAAPAVAASSSSNNNHSSSSSHLFLNYDPQFYQPPALNANDNCGSYDMEAKKRRKEEEKYENQSEKSAEKVMMVPAKMKLVKKVRSSDRANMEVVTNVSATKIEDHHQKGPLLISSSLETDHSSNSSSSNNGGNGNNVPIVRVCADCNTTKTPLWRSGPKGPKSLCNACGIRQRKARRAMAAAAAAAATANGGANGTAPYSPSTLKLKVQKATAKSNNYPSHHQQPLKKRCKFVTATAEASAPSSAAAAKNGVEDFLKKLSNSLALHRVFPQDEKDAAILLMAISCGLVHG